MKLLKTSIIVIQLPLNFMPFQSVLAHKVPTKFLTKINNREFENLVFFP